jgi:hypothetical protein
MLSALGVDFGQALTDLFASLGTLIGPYIFIVFVVSIAVGVAVAIIDFVIHLIGISARDAVDDAMSDYDEFGDQSYDEFMASGDHQEDLKPDFKMTQEDEDVYYEASK